MAQNKVAPCSLLVLGGSAGSLDILLQMLPCITQFKGAIILVMHRKSDSDNTLIQLFASRLDRPVSEPEEKDPVLPGHVYIAPPDYHLLVEKDFRFSLDFSERINYSRPSIDCTFESAADAYGPAVTGVLLSGANADGAAGLLAIQAAGGRVMVQNPLDAEVSYMPEQALKILRPDYIGDMTSLCTAINNLPQP